jgi:HEPN domain-containing protein
MKKNMQDNAAKNFHRWQEKAEDDIRAMEAMLKKVGLPNPVCFHAQQTAEKYLKGFLVFHGVRFAKIHNLTLLLDKCIEINPNFESLKADIVFLDTFYVETRYPGDFPEFSMKESEDAYAAAIRVKDFVLSKIK